MSDLRMIIYNEDSGEITIDPSKPFIPLTPLEEALQLFIVTLFTTIGSVVFDTSFGASGSRLLYQNRDVDSNQTNNRVGMVIHSAVLSLPSTQRQSAEYYIEDVVVRNVERTNRGLRITLRMSFRDAPPIEVKVPVNVAV